jgi:hypothetical protein
MASFTNISGLGTGRTPAKSFEKLELKAHLQLIMPIRE